MKKTINQILRKKKSGQKITMLTAYDHPTAKILDEAGVDIVLVGDSLANVVLGLDSTTQVGMAEMLHHTKAVRRAVKQALVIGDMPFEAYQKNTKKAVANAKRFMDAGCDAVKLEWFNKCPQVTSDIVKAGIPVMGHVGLTPQTAEKLGGMKVQGKDAASAVKILENAVELQKCGCFSIVLECIPDKLAGVITKKLKIPTIGIGAGADCDGQVLVINDMLGLFDRYLPKFVKRYANLQEDIKKAVGEYMEEVGSGKFPSKEYSFSMKEDEFEKLMNSPSPSLAKRGI